MVRPLLYETVLFLLPFAVYALWLAVRKVNPAEVEPWREAPLLGLLAAAGARGLGLGASTRQFQSGSLLRTS